VLFKKKKKKKKKGITTPPEKQQRNPDDYPFAESFVATAEEMVIETKRLAKQIASHYLNNTAADRITEENPLVVIGILKGSYIFMSDLCRELSRNKVPHVADFLCLSSYGSSSKSSGEVRMLLDLRQSCVGKHILVVEDIVDSGRTIDFLEKILSCRKPASLKMCVMLDKENPNRAVKDLKVDFYMMKGAFPGFLVGGGLDWNEKYRNLPDIVVLKPEVYTTTKHAPMMTAENRDHEGKQSSKKQRAEE
jgi:hypoxanthine phosphoribosyltransferase